MERENCFAYIDKKTCYCLTKKNCETCKFYKRRGRARADYMQNRVAALSSNIDKNIDNYFYTVLR